MHPLLQVIRMGLQVALHLEGQAWEMEQSLALGLGVIQEQLTGDLGPQGQELQHGSGK